MTTKPDQTAECETTGRCEPAGQTGRMSFCIHCGAEMHKRKFIGWVHWSHPDLGLDLPKRALISKDTPNGN